MNYFQSRFLQISGLVLFFSTALFFLFTQSACDDDSVYSLPDYPTKTISMWIEGESQGTGVGPACPGEDLARYGPRETLYIIYKDGSEFRDIIYGYYGSGPVDITVPRDGGFSIYMKVEGSCNECCWQYGPPDKFKPVFEIARNVEYTAFDLTLALEFQRCTYGCQPF